MSSKETFSLDDLKRFVREGMAEQRSIFQAARFQGRDREELLWLALPPCWTIQLAEMSRFPTREGDVFRFMEKMRESSLVRLNRMHAGLGEPDKPSTYTIDEATRRDVLATFVEQPENLAEVQPIITNIGKNILTAIDNRIDNPPMYAPAVVARWAALAAHASSTDEIVEEFDKHVDEAFSKGTSASIRDWINTAQPISELMLRSGNDSIKHAMQRASQRLILLRRKENDERHLKYFYQRDEQRQAFKELMESRDDQWALHFIGSGGVGKTMLIRKITVDWAKAENAAVARVDFDYLKADYPTLDPGMLLWAFAQDLRAQANRRAIIQFNDADKMFARLRQQISSSRNFSFKLRATDQPLFRRALVAYIEALRLMDQPVLLIVDTCEELTKIGIGKTAVENVEETFRILRALHDGIQTLDDNLALPSEGVPNLRIIFSGRRPLASAGTNWSCPSASHLSKRPFLRLHEIRGFKLEEARRFLAEQMKLRSEDIINAIVRRSSPDAGGIADIHWHNQSQRPTSIKDRRNPLDLRLYAEWALEDPPPTAQDILDTPAATQYVQLRVIRRLQSKDLEELLPGIALLGHFDNKMLLEVFSKEKDSETINTVFELLQQEEWISQHPGQDADGRANLILDVEPSLRQRLFSYFKNHTLLYDIQPRAADYLENITLNGNLSELDWSYFDAALTVLEMDQDATRAARWWKKVEHLIFSQRPPEWVLKVTSDMQGEGGAVTQRDPDSPPDTPPESRLRPAVLATHASALLRSTKSEDLPRTWRTLIEIWAEVREKAPLLPATEEAREALYLRAAAGLISAFVRVGNLDGKDIEQIQSFVRRYNEFEIGKLDDPQLVASFVAAAEAIIEYVEKIALVNATQAAELLRAANISKMLMGMTRFISRGDSSISSSPEYIVLEEKSPELVEHFSLMEAYVSSLVCRDFMLRGDHMQLRKNIYLLLHNPEMETATPQDAPWFDWRPPEDIASRVRLEFVRMAYPALMSAKEVLSNVGSLPMRLRSVDNERLHSALLRLRSATEVVPSKALSVFDWVDSATGKLVHRKDELVPGPEVCNAHYMTPPLFVTVCEILTANGAVDEALKQLKEARSPDKYSPETLLHAARARARIVSRMRLRDIGESSPQELEASEFNVPDRALYLMLEAQDGLKNRKPIPQLPPYLADFKVSDKNLEDIPEAEATNILTKKLGWLNAIWQTLYADDSSRSNEAIDWADKNLFGYVRYDLPQPSNALLISIYLDYLEARFLAQKYGIKADAEKLTGAVIGRIRKFLLEFYRNEGKVTLIAEFTFWLRLSALNNDLNSPDFDSPMTTSHTHIDRLGIRAAAEVALVEGDLLALRLPERAAILYKYAYDWFKQCDDDVGLFIAGTNLAMVHEKLKSLDASLGLSKSLRKAFETSAGVWLKEIPSDSERAKPIDTNLIDVASGTKFLEEHVSPSWRPRLARYALYLVEHGKTPREKRAGLGKSLIKHYLPQGVSKGEKETELFPADINTWVNRAARPPTRFESFVNILVQKVWPGVLIMSVLVGAGAVLYGVLALFELVFSFIVPDFPARGLWIQLWTAVTAISSLIVAVRLAFRARLWWQFYDRTKIVASLIYLALAVGGLAWYYFRGSIVELATQSRVYLTWAVIITVSLLLLYLFRSYIARFLDAIGERQEATNSLLFSWFNKLEIKLSTAQASFSDYVSSTELPEVQMESTYLNPGYNLRKLFFLEGKPEKLASTTVSLKNGIQPYEELAKHMAGDVHERFGRRPNRMEQYPMEVVIRLDGGRINGPCWEALLTSEAVDNRMGRKYLPFHFYRKLNTVATRPDKITRSGICMTVAESVLARSILRDGWHVWIEKGKQVVDPPSGELFNLAFTSSKDSLLWKPQLNDSLLGESTTNIEVMHFIGKADETEAGVGFRFGEELSNLAAQGSLASEQDDPLLYAEDLMRWYRDLSVCILQAEPQDFGSRRSESERRNAFFARIFASKISAAGVPLVICIPSLPSLRARAFVSDIARMLAYHKRLTMYELQKTIERLKMQILSLDTIDRVQAQELAQDICVYLNTSGTRVL